MRFSLLVPDLLARVIEGLLVSHDHNAPRKRQTPLDLEFEQRQETGDLSEARRLYEQVLHVERRKAVVTSRVGKHEITEPRKHGLLAMTTGMYLSVSVQSSPSQSPQSDE